MSTLSRNKVIEEVKRDLLSQDEKILTKAVTRCHEEGLAELVEPLIAFYASNGPAEIRQTVAEMLGTLKVSNVEPYFISALNNPQFKHIHRELMAFMWSTGINPGSGLTTVTEHAISGDFAMTLECLTLLESIESPLEEDVVLECITLVTRGISACKDGAQSKLLHEYLRVLNEQQIAADNE